MKNVLISTLLAFSTTYAMASTVMVPLSFSKHISSEIDEEEDADILKVSENVYDVNGHLIIEKGANVHYEMKKKKARRAFQGGKIKIELTEVEGVDGIINMKGSVKKFKNEKKNQTISRALASAGLGAIAVSAVSDWGRRAMTSLPTAANWGAKNVKSISDAGVTVSLANNLAGFAKRVKIPVNALSIGALGVGLGIGTVGLLTLIKKGKIAEFEEGENIFGAIKI